MTFLTEIPIVQSPGIAIASLKAPPTPSSATARAGSADAARPISPMATSKVPSLNGRSSSGAVSKLTPSKSASRAREYASCTSTRSESTPTPETPKVRARYSVLTPRPHAASSTSFSGTRSVSCAMRRYRSSPPGGKTVSRLRRTRSSIDGPRSRGGGGIGRSSRRSGMRKV